MKNTVSAFKLLSDPARLRMLMLLRTKELCVCQIMGILGISQPLVSRNLKLLDSAGLLKERKAGKLVFYSLSDRMQALHSDLIDLMAKHLRDDPVIHQDIRSMKECREFQEKIGKCDMKTFLSYMEKKRRKKDT